MRIIGGSLRGRRLITPSNNIIRPTSDRVRETVFNILSHKIDFADIDVLDLYSGTGALGLEALSRGAKHCVFVDSSREGHRATSENIKKLGVDSNSTVLRSNAAAPDKLKLSQKFNLVFMDPPYGNAFVETTASSVQAGGMTSENCWIVVEEASRSFPHSLAGYDLRDSRKIGDTTIGFFKTK